ncbi:MAG: LytTR family transcriptional regulator DNA-binding domain-containing protein [Lachnospiraceae bacterium]|nr:LytTR family transcriptional regulator DNA-binding domain-containing protein [Lachnospiraceae bacterium]
MSIFIAILDDNPADRKQSERLLSRERDVRVKQNEVIYFDTYGSRDAILSCAAKYDLFLIDISNSTPDGFMTAVHLINNGAAGRMVLASSKIDYKAKYGRYEDFIFIDKPLLQKHFTELVDIAKEHKEKQVPRLEFRGEKDTIYVTKDEIIYLKEEGHMTAIFLTKNRTFNMAGGIRRVSFELSTEEFIQTDDKTVINMARAASLEKNAFRMSNGAMIRFNIFNRSRITKAWEKYSASKE